MNARRTTLIVVVLTVLAIFLGGTIIAMSTTPHEPDAGPTGNTAPGGPVVAFYGDSYTLGTGASDPSKRWSTVISAERGWNEVNPSVNGLGFVNNRDRLPEGGDLVEQVIAAKPDILFITMGLNDNFSMPERADDIEAAIHRDFTTIRNNLPRTRIIVVEPFWYTDDRPQSLDTISGWVEREGRAIGADLVPGASHWIEGHPEWMASDGLHPNDDGYAQIARRMDEELSRLGLGVPSGTAAPPVSR
ncbi:SGNH/GDSL hydrolase family protein [Agreia sp. COWG]|uniref:SGNH/GDSL hydrolase family protein n=1 Tax=Agreia sp. COWG TaxID=2773266 RepID=UPI001928CCA1|nr:SGNH/GDSL hydrolase family protein [Agreia sp. COWG]CAD5992328.1 Lysophospholipase L1 [Agreia sp. COWG]